MNVVRTDEFNGTQGGFNFEFESLRVHNHFMQTIYHVLYVSMQHKLEYKILLKVVQFKGHQVCCENWQIAFQP